MKSSRTAILAVILLFLVLLFGALFFLSQPGTSPESPLPSPTHPIASPDTPTPSQQVIDGEILTISDEPIGFKNSLVTTLELEDGTSVLVYITEDTVITDSQGENVSRTTLQEGMQIQIMVQPSEGGYEAIRVQTTQAVPSPTIPRSTPTPTITE